MRTDDPYLVSWRDHMPGRPEPDPEYFDTPYLTAAVNICSAVGFFIGVWTVIILVGDLHRGFTRYWPLVLILAIDLGVNVALRVARHRRRAPDGGDSTSAPGFERRLQPR
jgi:hypothetical protein